ncbi:hypothetical protein ACJ41O_007580 [Fusarium nematophilum]
MAAYRNGLLVIGAGGMGLAIARRLGAGNRVILADFSEKILNSAATSLQDDGHTVETQVVDVSSYESVEKLAKFASGKSRLQTVVNTAGISPAMGTARQVHQVDLLGTANILDAFLRNMPPGSSLTCIASIAGHMMQKAISPELEKHLATSPREKLLEHSSIDLEGSTAVAYGVAKWGNVVRVQAAMREARKYGVRVNTVSPGVIRTAMVRKELETEAGDRIRRMIEESPVSRAGCTDDIAALVAFLSGPDASFINGADFVIDGGATAASRFGGLDH